MLKRFGCLLALAFLLFSPSACKNDAAKNNLNAQPDSQTQTSPRPDSQTKAEEVVAAPAKFDEEFVGSIGEKLAIRMELERKGDELTGSYFYERPGAFNSALRTLDLKGRIDGDGNVVLSESSQNLETGNAQKTGEFKGKLDGVNANGDVSLRFSGDWIGGKDQKKTPFSLRQIRYDLGGLKLETKKQESANKSLRLEIETALPQLVGSDSGRVDGFNNAALDLVARRADEFQKSLAEVARATKQGEKSTAAKPSPDRLPNSMAVSYEVTAANKDFISILFSFFEYAGGAHPNTNTVSFNYDLKRNTPVRLADLFAPDSNYLKVISDYSLKELKKLDTVSFAEEGAGPKLENFHSWNITPAGLRITFDPYQVGAYAAGEHEVIVPYSVLKPIIKPDGPLAQFAK